MFRRAEQGVTLWQISKIRRKAWDPNATTINAEKVSSSRAAAKPAGSKAAAKAIGSSKAGERVKAGVAKEAETNARAPAPDWARRRIMSFSRRSDDVANM